MTKILKEILSNVEILKIIGYVSNKCIKGITLNSKNIKNNFIFVAKTGDKTCGYNFINEAIKKGSNTIICEYYKKINFSQNITYIIVKNSVKSLGIISSNFYGNPTKKIILIGIIGTNGKTSTASILHQLFNNIGENSILISTIGIKILYDEYSTKNTTPNIIDINKYLSIAIKKKCKYAFMEVSSHAIKQNRICGLLFRGAIFTNITHDHLDYHKTFNNYISVKKYFFDKMPKNSFSLINHDDENFSEIIKNTLSNVYFYGLKKKSNFIGKILSKNFNGTKLILNDNKVFTNLVGEFNIYNLLAGYSIARLLGKNKKNILNAIHKINPIKGRFEQFLSKSGIRIIVDYAHNPDGLKNVLKNILDIIDKKHNLICVIGCGGNRDKKKRKIMGKIVYEMCNVSIFTSDNPRMEDPNKIIEDMKKFKSSVTYNNIVSIIDRKKAIKYAIKIAKKNDVILITGRGHENYQNIKGKFYKFNDIDITKKLIND